MKLINNAPKVLSFVQFDNEDEEIFMSEMVDDLGFTNVIFTDNGFFCLTTEVFEIMDIMKENAAEAEEAWDSFQIPLYWTYEK